jgi:hypothetical protein
VGVQNSIATAAAMMIPAADLTRVADEVVGVVDVGVGVGEEAQVADHEPTPL